MRKILFYLLLLISSVSIGQTSIANKLKITAAIKDNLATRVMVQDSLTGELKWVLKNSLGTVKSVTGLNGVTVATGTTTPVIGLGAITPTSTNGVSAATMAFNDATSSIQTQLNGKQPSGTYATGTGTASGTNTGDNAVNSLYSGLVTNATHTGDATGATALTVKGINGTLLSGLATGILKNTTTTGVPSIAVAADFPTLNQNTTGTAAGLSSNITESQVTNLVSDLSGKAPSTGGTGYIQNQNASAQSANMWISGTSRLNSVKATGRIYSTGNANFDDLVSTTGSVVVWYDPINVASNIASRNYSTSTNLPLQFQASSYSFLNGEATFGSSVKVGTIGSSIPSLFGLASQRAVYAVSGNKTIYLYNDGANVNLDAYDYGTSTPINIGIANNGGNVLIGTTTGDGVNKLQVNGSVKISGTAGELLRLTRTGGADWAIELGGGNDLYFKNKQSATTPFSIVSGVVKVNNLSGSGTRTVVADASGNLSTTSTSNPNYKVYTALLSQTGTSAPTATVLENTLGGTVVWTRNTNGSYIGTLAEVFTLNKTAVLISCIGTNFISSFRSSVSTITVNTYVSSGGSADDRLFGNTIEIRVYN